MPHVRLFDLRLDRRPLLNGHVFNRHPIERLLERIQNWQIVGLTDIIESGELAAKLGPPNYLLVASDLILHNIFFYFVEKAVSELATRINTHSHSRASPLLPPLTSCTRTSAALQSTSTMLWERQFGDDGTGEQLKTK